MNKTFDILCNHGLIFIDRDGNGYMKIEYNDSPYNVLFVQMEEFNTFLFINDFHYWIISF